LSQNIIPGGDRLLQGIYNFGMNKDSVNGWKGFIAPTYD
jgi:hypothetical protein